MPTLASRYHAKALSWESFCLRMAGTVSCRPSLEQAVQCKECVVDLFKDSWCYRAFNRWREQRRYRAWLQSGRNGPPPHLAKQAVLREFHQRHALSVLVETGTYLGDMVAAMSGIYEKIYSIELSTELHRRAVRRFARDPSISILQGDSGIMLARIVAELERPTLFWLDGHYSGGITAKGDRSTPILSELTTVMALQLPFVVLIDDAMLFNGTKDYPTMEELKAHIERLRPGTAIEVETDIIRITPPALQSHAARIAAR
jgi:hypothetical protein